MVSCSKLRVMIMSSLMLWSSVVAAQTSAPTKPSEGTLSPQAAATRKTEVQKELKALQETKLPNDRFQSFQAEKRLTAATPFELSKVCRGSAPKRSFRPASRTGPILASIGILGLAIGFASQSLIKDVINGLFILFEDSISVGDIANLHGIGGQVEKITLRAVTLRSLDGTVHVIPNSAIDVASNMTKGFSRYVLDVRVALTEDVDKVMDIMRKVDEEMRGDPEFGKDMLFPIELWGVDRFEDSSLIIRARLNTKPIQQWRIGREFNRRMKQAFEAQGVQIPVPHRMLFWSTPPNRQDNLNTVLEDYAPLMEDKESKATGPKT